MKYDLAAGRELMNRAGWVTICFAYAETPQLFHTRNPFASGGVYEDPATGAATAALAGYLRDIDWPQAERSRSSKGKTWGCDLASRQRFTQHRAVQSGSQGQLG
jgi:predicted PhzF superfamily epimerase YddE/YHI9